MKYFVIVNPNSAGGKGLKNWNKMRTYLKRHGIRHEMFFTRTSGDAARIAAKLAEDTSSGSTALDFVSDELAAVDADSSVYVYTADGSNVSGENVPGSNASDGNASGAVCSGEKTDIPECMEKLNILVVGGDGTLNEVINGLKFLHAAVIGFVPSGSGNDYARGLRLSRKPKSALDGIFKYRRVEAMDYGVLSCGSGGFVRRFANSCGIGLDAHVCQQLSRYSIEGRKDFLAGSYLRYVVEGARALMFFRPMSAQIVMDGNRKAEFSNIVFISAHILPLEGGGFRFAGYADPKDGMLELCVVNCRSKLKLLSLLIAGRLKGYKNSRYTKHYQCREATIHTERAAVVHTDGECIAPQSDITVSCTQQKLYIYR